jgi:hypothetical protein
VRTERPAVPGSRITLRPDPPVKPGSHYLWVQTRGPAVDAGEWTGPELRLRVPRGADALGFLLVVADDRGIRTARVDVPIAPPASSEAGPTGPALEAGDPVAEAGEDRAGLVGRAITLDGSASRPRLGLAYRWVQVGGPEVRSPVEAGPSFSFVPGAEGVYRFALVVAHRGRISPPDHVTVTVGVPPGLRSAAGPGSPGAAPLPGDVELEAVVGTAWARLEGAPSLADPLAEVFSTAAFRMDLYSSYADAYSELSRRLDAILPRDPIRRAHWGAALFQPLTRVVVARLLPSGIDLRTAAGRSTPLTDSQKGELKDQFERIARIIRAARSHGGADRAGGEVLDPTSNQEGSR